jgi:hypothetical protein
VELQRGQDTGLFDRSVQRGKRALFVDAFHAGELFLVVAGITPSTSVGAITK